jgi:hypothetical protein
MAITDLVGPVIGGAVGSALALIQPVGRSIGQIFPDVVIEESHADESIVTQDPVQGGALVTDHIFDRPPLVAIRGGFSNSSAGYVGYVQEQYQELLRLKAAKTPFFLSTGKRPYRDMVIQAIQVVTDPRSEYVLMFTAICVHINIVKGSTAGNDPTTGGPASNQANQTDPAASAGVSNSGTVAANPVSETAFAGAYGPGSVLNPGSGVAAGSIGDGSFGAVSEGLSGISAPPTAVGEVGELTVEGLPEATVPASPGYNPFATGAFGGT